MNSSSVVRSTIGYIDRNWSDNAKLAEDLLLKFTVDSCLMEVDENTFNH